MIIMLAIKYSLYQHKMDERIVNITTLFSTFVVSMRHGNLGVRSNIGVDSTIMYVILIETIFDRAFV